MMRSPERVWSEGGYWTRGGTQEWVGWLRNILYRSRLEGFSQTYGGNGVETR